MIGIYQIKNLKTNKIYIGSSVNVFKRWWDHKSLLKRNAHRNIHLQRAWNLDGEYNFEFKFIEECSLDNILEKEQNWIDWLNCTNDNIGYNIAECAEASARGSKRNLEQRKRLSEAHKGIKLKPHVIEGLIKRNLGSKRSLEAKQNMSNAQKNNKALFKPDKWPHGWRCRCEECKILQKIEKRKYPDYRRIKSEIQVMKGFQL